MPSFWNELQRRNVVRVGLAYLAVAWLVIQLAGEVGPILGFPLWFPKVLLGLLAAGFLITTALAWVYEITNKGLKRTEEVDRDETLHSLHGRQLDFVIIGALLLALVYFVWESRFAEPETMAAGIDSVAVLPFRDLSAAGDQQYFADGVSEELLNALSRIPGLKVAGRSSSFSFRDAEPDVQAIASALHVSHVLEGSIRTSGDQLRVSAQLVNAANGFQVWSRVFEGRLDEVFRVQDELAQLVVDAVQADLLGDEPAGIPNARTTTLAAYNAYLLGRFELSQRTPDSIPRAIEHFRQAIGLDPAYAPAYSALAKTLAISFYYVQLGSPDQLFTEARDLADHSIELDPLNSEAYSVLGFISMVFDHNWSQAKMDLLRSVELSPGGADNLNLYGDYLYTVGDYQAALEIEGKAAELEPLSASNQHELALVKIFLGRYDDAIALEKLAVQLNPQFSNAWGMLARIYLLTGQNDEFRQLQSSSEANFSTYFELWLDVLLQLQAGSAPPNGEAMATLLASGQQGAISLTHVAYLFARMGDDATSADLVAQAYFGKDPILVSPLYFFLPEDWPDLPLTQAALDHPDLQELYRLRRQHIAAGSGRLLVNGL